MDFISETVTDGVLERLFNLQVDGQLVPGVLWTPEAATGHRPLVLMGHGGSQHKQFVGVVTRARRYVSALGFAVAAIDAPSHGQRPVSDETRQFVETFKRKLAAREPFGEDLARENARQALLALPEWRAVLDALERVDNVGSGPVGYWGLSLGAAIGLQLVAAEPRIRAAVLGLVGLLPEQRELASAAAQISVPIEYTMQWDDELVPRATSLALYAAFGSSEKSLHANPGGHAGLPRFESESSERFFARHLKG